MSERSLRHVIKRREYKERSQPTDRAHLGLLEKKKDYKERAVDFHKKADEIKRLKNVVLTKNPDEYSQKMMKVVKKDGVNVRIRREVDMTKPANIKAKAKDLNHAVNLVRIHESMEKRQESKLKESLHLLDENVLNKVKRKHVIFTDSIEEAATFNPVKHFKTVPELVNRSYNRLTVDQLESGNIILNKVESGDMEQIKHSITKSYKKLGEQSTRLASLKESQTALQNTKFENAVNAKKMYKTDEFGDVIKSSVHYKFKQERQR